MTEKRTKKVSYHYIHKIKAATLLIAFLVLVIGGWMQGTRIFTTFIRATFILVPVMSAIAWLLIKVLATYEEMDSGKS
jgi:ABC-type multidrug transport system permease subunit